MIRHRWLAAGLALAVLAGGCSSASSTTDASAGSMPINVAVVTITDGSPFFVALQHGFFKQVGLDVTYETAKQSTTVMPQLLANRVNVIGAANYVNAFEAELNGTAKLSVLAEDGECGTDTDSVLALPHSDIAKPSDLIGKTVATNIVGNIQQLMINRQLEANNVNPANVHFVEIPFNQEVEALASHKVNAINEVEPFVSEAENRLGAEVVLPVCSGPTAGMPLTGWLASAAWVQTHRDTALAFQRAIDRGQALADTTRPSVEAALESPSFLHLSKQIASIVNLNYFPSDVNAVHLQRVADLMLAGGVIKKPFDVTPLLVK